MLKSTLKHGKVTTWAGISGCVLGGQAAWILLPLGPVWSIVLWGFALYLGQHMVRRAQQRARAQAVAEVREMLVDVIRNQIAIIQMNADSTPQDTARRMRAQERIATSIMKILSTLDDLSEASLDDWKDRYRTLLEREMAASRQSALNIKL